MQPTEMNNSTCVIIPAYNVADSIGGVVSGVRRYIPVVFVADDGSVDDTAMQARAAGAVVLRWRRNRGKGYALKALFACAAGKGFRTAISMDGDGQHDYRDLPRFAAAHRRHPEAIIVGSRMHAKGNIPRARYNSMHVARFFISLAANQFVEDTQCGFRVYPLKRIEGMCLTQPGYVTESEMLIKAGDMGCPIRFVRIGAIYGRIKSHFKPIRDVTAITAYIISYFVVKYTVEGICPRRPNTYKPGGIRDKIAANRMVDVMFEMLTVLGIIPLTGVFMLLFGLFSKTAAENYASVRRLDQGFYKITLATHLLPLILVIISVEKVAGCMGVRMRLIDGFIQKFYPHLW